MRSVLWGRTAAALNLRLGLVWVSHGCMCVYTPPPPPALTQRLPASGTRGSACRAWCSGVSVPFTAAGAFVVRFIYPPIVTRWTRPV